MVCRGLPGQLAGLSGARGQLVNLAGQPRSLPWQLEMHPRLQLRDVQGEEKIITTPATVSG